MQTFERIPAVEGSTTPSWSRVFLESALAIVGALIITGIIDVFQLYPRIPNISILYLFVVLGLASTFGLYAAVAASVVAFLSFDYFIVPPLYTFTINRWDEWIALFVFLATALFTSQLTAIARQRTEQAERREREAKILYELIRMTNAHEHFDDQIGIFVEAIARVFTAWGVRSCALLLMDEHNMLTQSAEASLLREGITLSPEDKTMALAVLNKGQMMERRLAPQPDYRDEINHISHYSTVGPITILRFIPMKAGKEILGVLCLRIQKPVSWFTSVERMQEEQNRSNSRIGFFWTFLEQGASILERARLRAKIVTGNK